MNNSTVLMLISGGWLGYFLLHSLLASPMVKSRFAQSNCYRLTYNLIAIITLLPQIWLHTLYTGTPVIHWPGPWGWLAGLMSLAAFACFLWTLRYYDLGEFSGWHACRGSQTSAPLTALVISPPHRYVRHPWYSCALILLWSRDMDLAQLLTTLLISGYFVVGSRLEERRLIDEHGNRYREYMQHVPGLIPLPWKNITHKEAARIMSQTHPE